MKTVLIAIISAMLLVSVFRHNAIEYSKVQNTLTAVRAANEIEYGKLQNALNEVRAAQAEQNRILADITARIAETQKIRAEVTAYTLDLNETDNDPQHAADMSKPVPGRTAAVSRDLIHLLGKKIYIPGHGVRVINDLAAVDVKGTIDLLVGNKAEARKIGREVREVIVL